MSDAKALRAIADQMEDSEAYRTDAMGIEALCLRNSAARIEKLEVALRTIKEEHRYGLPSETTHMIDAALGEK